MREFQPMLAAKVTDLTKLQWPLLASPKYDGIRAVVRNGKLLSRSLKPIPNMKIRQWYSHRIFEGFDGELVVGEPTAKDVFNRTSSTVSSVDGDLAAWFYVFDVVNSRPFDERYDEVSRRLCADQTKGLRLELVPQRLVLCAEEFLAVEGAWVGDGYEGVVLRDPSSRYKFGRSTARERCLLKVKRFDDGEAEILGAIELRTNNNEATRNALGQLERSSKKSGLVAGGTLGALVVRDIKTDVTFNIGSGPVLTKDGRAQLWQMYIEGRLVGKVCKYRYFPVGVKLKPRFPTLRGFRGSYDMS